MKIILKKCSQNIYSYWKYKKIYSFHIFKVSVYIEEGYIILKKKSAYNNKWKIWMNENSN
jgi:hypothetical protein